MTCKLCPAKKNCWDKGTCEECDFFKAFEHLDKKIKKLKAENKDLQSQNEILKKRIDIITNHNF